MQRYEDRQWRDAMRIRVDYNNMLRPYVGEMGLDAAELTARVGQYAAAAAAMEAKRDSGMKWRNLPYNQGQVVQKLLEAAGYVRENFDTFVVLGIGGSALGPIAVQQALSHLRYNDLPKERRAGPKLYVEDNVHPERMASFFDVIDVKRTCFNVITKSGSTSETMAQLLLFTEALRREVGEDWSRHAIATTDESNSQPKVSLTFFVRSCCWYQRY